MSVKGMCGLNMLVEWKGKRAQVILRLSKNTILTVFPVKSILIAKHGVMLDLPRMNSPKFHLLRVDTSLPKLVIMQIVNTKIRLSGG